MSERTRADELAELVCVLYGWTAPGRDTERDLALHQLWTDWVDAHGMYVRRDYPQLSDERIAELAERRRTTEAEMLAAMAERSITPGGR